MERGRRRRPKGKQRIENARQQLSNDLEGLNRNKWRFVGTFYPVDQLNLREKRNGQTCVIVAYKPVHGRSKFAKWRFILMFFVYLSGFAFCNFYTVLTLSHCSQAFDLFEKWYAVTKCQLIKANLTFLLAEKRSICR